MHVFNNTSTSRASLAPGGGPGVLLQKPSRRLVGNQPVGYVRRPNSVKSVLSGVPEGQAKSKYGRHERTGKVRPMHRKVQGETSFQLNSEHKRGW